jgi:hypothetical protein
LFVILTKGLQIMNTLQYSIGTVVLLVGSPALGDLVGVHSEQVDFSQGLVMADGSLYSGDHASSVNRNVRDAWAIFSQTHTVFRFYADFDNPADQLVFFGSYDVAHLRAEIISPTSTDFFDPNASNLLPPAMWNFSSRPTWAFDSWITIGAATWDEAVEGGGGIYTAGPLPTTFIGGFDVPSEESLIAVPPTDTNGVTNPLTLPDAQGRVLYAQVAVPLETFFDLDGTLIFRPNGSGAQIYIPFQFRSVSAGGDLPCPADANADGAVGIDDFLAVLSEWGMDCSVDTCSADGDGNGTIGIDDFLMVLSEWGMCPQ